MSTFLQPGDTVELTAPTGGVVVNVPVQIGQLLVIPTVTAAQTVRFNGMTSGIHTIVKLGSQAWAEGDLVYWDVSAANFTTTATGNMLAGVAIVVTGAGAGETVGVVRLNGMARADEA